jgi:methionine sulfoxide reductase heme-binding subunit
MSSALWYLSRSTGLVSFLLLSLVMVMGATISRRGKVLGMPRFAGVGLHRNASLFAIVLLAIHIVTAVLDPYVTIGWFAVLVPFTSSYEPFWLGLGALAIDLVVALVITSLLRFKIGIATWRKIHWVAYAAWPIAAVHGIGAAADLQGGILLGVVIATITVVVGAVVWRVLSVPPKRPTAAPIRADFAGRPDRDPVSV